MTSTGKHGKETAKSARRAALTPEQEKEIGNQLASMGLFNPLSIALAKGKLQSVPPRGRPGRPQNLKIAERDARIVQMRDQQTLTYRQIAQKLNPGRRVTHRDEMVCQSAYRRMKVKLNSR